MNSIQIENCQKFYAIAQSRLAGDTSGHSLDHVLRVVNNAVLIARDEAICDLYLIVAAALLHDVIDDKLTANMIDLRKRWKRLILLSKSRSLRLLTIYPFPRI